MSHPPSSMMELDVLSMESRKRSFTTEVASVPSVTPTKSGEPSLGNGSLGTRSSSAPPSRKQITTGRIQFLALCFCLFLAGWNDGSTGPLLLRIQDAYHVNFLIVSLMFVFACVGFVSGALINVPLNDKLGFGRVIAIGALCQVVGYAIQAPGPPFPAFVFAFVINGVGIALQDAQANGFVATLKDNPEAKMGILHAAYGVGALAAPLVATQFAQLHRWSFHYMISLGLTIANAIVLWVVFRFKNQDDCLLQAGETVAQKVAGEDDHKFRQIMQTKAVHLLALFTLVYVGVEVTIGGWIVTFIIQVRKGGPSSGYISSGFFGGLALGRVLLLWVNQKVGERRALFIYAFLAIGLEIVVWTVPSLVGDAIAISIVGLLLGPMYPIAMNHASRVLPRWILTGSIGWIAGFGQAGSAVLPFMTGAIAEKHGIKTLHPFLAAMMVVMTLLWAIVPRTSRRGD